MARNEVTPILKPDTFQLALFHIDSHSALALSITLEFLNQSPSEIFRTFLAHPLLFGATLSALPLSLLAGFCPRYLIEHLKFEAF